MTVYLDNLRAPWRRMTMCHMIADSERELHDMAEKMGLKKSWYQGDHYDVSLGRRLCAIGHGAVCITRRELAAMVSLKRRDGTWGDPKTAIDRSRAPRQGGSKAKSEGARK